MHLHIQRHTLSSFGKFIKHWFTKYFLQYDWKEKVLFQVFNLKFYGHPNFLAYPAPSDPIYPSCLPLFQQTSTSTMGNINFTPNFFCTISSGVISDNNSESNSPVEDVQRFWALKLSETGWNGMDGNWKSLNACMLRAPVCCVLEKIWFHIWKTGF